MTLGSKDRSNVERSSAGATSGKSGSGREYLAAVDVGTNSFHLVVARLLPTDGFSVVDKEKIVVRLGQSPKQIKHIADEAIERGVNAMSLFSHVAGRYNAPIRAVATSATREAENGRAFIERVRDETGIDIEVVSGIEEARLIYLGVLQALPLHAEKIALFDIGGGSTEILVGEQGRALWANSFKIGAIRMTERFFPDEKITGSQVERLRLYLRGELYDAARQLKEHHPARLIASSGTALTIAAMALNASGRAMPDRMNDVTITRSEVRKVVKSILAAKTFEARAAIPGCDPRRADILAAGGIVLETILDELEFDELTTSSFALREGIILDTIRKESLHAERTTPTRLLDQRLEAVVRLGRTYDFDERHGRQVARLSGRLFDLLEKQHRLESDTRELLEAAAWLHDIGYYIAPSSHHKHAYYLIANSAMLGFNREEIELIAQIARYHRKSLPTMRHEALAELGDDARRTVTILAGILRIADNLDRTHRSHVADVELAAAKKRKRMTIGVRATEQADVSFELWSATRKTGLLAESLCWDVEIEEIRKESTNAT